MSTATVCIGNPAWTYEEVHGYVVLQFFVLHKLCILHTSAWHLLLNQAIESLLQATNFPQGGHCMGCCVAQPGHSDVREKGQGVAVFALFHLG